MRFLSTVCYLWPADYRAPSSVWFAQRALLRQFRSRGPITKTDKGRARRLGPDDLVFTSSTGTR